MRRTRIAAVAAMLLASCSQGDGGRQAQHEASDATESPNISPTAAPGVAFRYSYDFQLPDEAISVVQEAHAAKCEALGTQRCRITGLRYTVSGDDAITALLEVKLAPEIARQFGKVASGDVTKADGKLLNTEFAGEDVTPTTEDAARRQSDLSDRISALEAQLTTARSGPERAQLQQQLNELRTQLEAARSTIVTATEKLASTPMTFNYYGRGGISGFATNPVRDAARSFVSSLVTMVTFLLQAIAVLLPWALLLALFVLIWRSRPMRGVRRFFATKPGADEES